MNEWMSEAPARGSVSIEKLYLHWPIFAVQTPNIWCQKSDVLTPTKHLEFYDIDPWTEMGPSKIVGKDGLFFRGICNEKHE